MVLKNLEVQDFMLSVVFALLGALFVSGAFIDFITRLPVLVGLIFSYLFYTVMIIILSKLGLVVLAFKMQGISKFIGMSLITIAMVIILSWGNVVDLTYCSQNPDSCINPLHYQSFDGVLWLGFTAIIKPTSALNLNIVKALTYIFAPFALAFSGGLLLKGAPEVSPV